MQNAQHLPDTEPYRGRFYRREWKLKKPHLPKSNSLPVFKLLPLDRPIFTCGQCGFINTLIPLCLWCCWSSDMARQGFERSTPRPRRASAPPRVLWKPNPSLTSRRTSHRTLTSQRSATPQRLGNHSDVCFPSITLTSLQTQVLQDGKESIRSTNLLTPCWHAPPTTNSETSIGYQGFPLVAKATRHGRQLVSEKLRRPRSDNSLCKDEAMGFISRNTSLYFPLLRHSASAGVDRRSPMDLRRSISTKSLGSKPIVIDLKGLNESYDFKLKSINANLSVNTPPSPQRTLKRKKRLTLLRAPSPTPTRPQSTSTSSIVSSVTDQHLEEAPHFAATVAHAHFSVPPQTKPTTSIHMRSRSQPTNIVRLGHPSRPYYSAIRPSLGSISPPPSPKHHPPSSRPSSQQFSNPGPSRPASLPAPLRAPSPGILSVLSSTSALSDDEEEDLSIDMFTQRARSASVNDPHPLRPLAFGPTSRPPGGFSLSGETELRMALATEDADEFKFKDMRKGHGETRVVRKMRELKKGLKGLVMGK